MIGDDDAGLTSKITKKPRATYAFAGVHRDRAAQAHERIKLTARRSFNKSVLSEIGGFAGLFALDAEKTPDPVLVASTDGVGAKLQLAAELGLHASVGADLVNHCVNDIAVQGATPLFFLDYFAAGELDPDVVQQVVQGIVDACRANGCALLGGETAEMPTLYRGKEYDLAGFIVGVVSRSRLVSGNAIEEGDVLLGLPSNGLHTNSWQRPTLFTHLQTLGSIEDNEMLHTFNMGIGLVAVVPAPLVKKARLILSRANERSFIIGRVVRAPQRKVLYS
jgi:phosphoribosylformylglycinamidine cyclo-ligase